MRVFFVTNAVTERFSVNRYLGFGIDDVFSSSKSFLMSLIFGKLPDVTSGNEFDEEVESHFMKERKDYEAKLNIFLKETPETAMLIYGPKGTRHTDLVEKCTKSEPYIMRIRLDEIINQPDHIFLDKLSRQTGCFPMFNWTVSTGSLLDTIVTATTGTKAGFASTAESQIRKIFEITTIALNRIVHSEHQKRQAALNHFQLSNQAPPSTDAVPDIEYPVIVIEGFLGNEKAKQAYVYELLTEWTNTLVEMQVAQVVFVSDNPAAVKYLSRAIPRKTIETIALADASFTSSISYAQGRLGLVFGQRLPVELEQAIYALGGRLTDLEQLVQKVKAALRAKNQNSNNNNSNGTILQKLRRTAFVSESHDVSDAALATPEQLADAASHAFNDIVVRTETEIRKIGLFEDIGVATVSSSSLPVKKEWTAVQMWKIIQLLTKFEEVSYDDLRYHPLFKGDETAIQAIERAGLISIGLHEGRPYIIRAGRPVYRTAFARLQSDKKYSAIMGLKTVKTLVNDETVKLKEYESELSTLTGQILTDRIGLWGASDLRSRANFVAKLIGESHVKLAALDAEERKLKKVVKLVE
ncbi:mitochondrial escape protein 2 [Physocladia obscura]|uniref:Mitochondrial escape protein 2 n=1 Tax=Physocladia obscura TaxID=109957 RepID=A0AAD5X9R0_9FUNG|nr:mitochondrial escape protein 2 [Physocladia obscura]